MKLEYYIHSEGKRLRCGYTTGTCASAAARLSAEYLLSGIWPTAVSIETPAGITVIAEPEDAKSCSDYASCAVRKDAGDDIDVTEGMLIYAQVRLLADPVIVIKGGEGIGLVSRPGLDQPVGAAAINSVPRKMIKEQLEQAAAFYEYTGGFEVTVSAPDGLERSRKTFNPKLGIIGGLSILGTTGIVRPMSEQALIDTIKTELRIRCAEGKKNILVVPGNIGGAFADASMNIKTEDIVQCSNYIGEAIDNAAALGFSSFLLVGHAGKLIKLAAGIMNTHSRTADGRAEIITAHAAVNGASKELALKLMNSLTTDEALELLSKAGLLRQVMQSITMKIEENLHRRAGDSMRAEAIFFSGSYGILGRTSGADEMLRLHTEL